MANATQCVLTGENHVKHNVPNLLDSKRSSYCQKVQKRSRIIFANEFLAAWVFTKSTNAKVALQICTHHSRAITEQPRIDASNVYETILVRADWPLQGLGKVIHGITHVQCKAITESVYEDSIPFV